jgi:hypothetical protein
MTNTQAYHNMDEIGAVKRFTMHDNGRESKRRALFR